MIIFSEILQFVNRLNCKIPVNDLLARSESLLVQIQNCISTPPVVKQLLDIWSHLPLSRKTQKTNSCGETAETSVPFFHHSLQTDKLKLNKYVRFYKGSAWNIWFTGPAGHHCCMQNECLESQQFTVFEFIVAKGPLTSSSTLRKVLALEGLHKTCEISTKSQLSGRSQTARNIMNFPPRCYRGQPVYTHPWCRNSLLTINHSL